MDEEENKDKEEKLEEEVKAIPEEKPEEKTIPKEKPKVEKAKESNFTKKIRKNPYIVATFVLGLFCILLITGSFVENKTIDKIGNETINKTENEILCSVMGVTPAWAIDGRIIEFGILPINQSIDLVNQILIPNKIKLLYSSDCSACEAQINYIKGQGTWDAYQNEGLTINCQEVLG